MSEAGLSSNSLGKMFMVYTAEKHSIILLYEYHMLIHKNEIYCPTQKITPNSPSQDIPTQLTANAWRWTRHPKSQGQ